MCWQAGWRELQKEQVEVGHEGVDVGDGLPPVVKGGVLRRLHLEGETHSRSQRRNTLNPVVEVTI